MVEGADGRPLLVLVPGTLNDAGLWRDEIAALSPHVECRVADITQGTTFQALAEAVLSVASRPFALAGFSLGGIVAQEVVRLAPERVQRLALLDTSFKPDSPERLRQRLAHNAAARAPGRFLGIGDRLLETYLHPKNRTNVELGDRIRAMTQRLGPEVFVRQNSLERPDGSAVLASLKVPVLVLCGAGDRITPLAEHQAMMELLANGELFEVPDAGHMTPMENPAFVTAALKHWLFEMV